MNQEPNTRTRAPRPRFRTLKRMVSILFLAFIAIQFVRPSLNNHPASAEIQVPDDVKQILKTSCYDCHSTESKLAWFDQPAPAYWLVVRDIREARKHLDFSEIGKLPAGQQKAALYETLFQIQSGAMPLPAYRRLHAGTALTAEKIAVLKNYLSQQKEITPSTTAEIAAADSEFMQWLPNGNALALNVPLEPNGIAFLPEYKNWIPISSTDRFDNHTIRQILGNDVAIKAIAERHINPWPDGTGFAKVAWTQQTDANGIVHPGIFYQVEFMFRDSKKYAATLGWGWGRWRSTNLKPYGKDAHFDQECVGCHRPLKKTDYVFTAPIPLSPVANDTRSLLGELPANPLSWRQISSELDRTSGTMSTLYGNDTAVNHARTLSQPAYPSSSILALVTWRQKPDERWFGANIPNESISVEFVTVGTAADKSSSYTYERYEGSPLKKTSSQDSVAAVKDRTTYILVRRAAVMP